jgi:hypothetical protein
LNKCPVKPGVYSTFFFGKYSGEIMKYISFIILLITLTIISVPISAATPESFDVTVEIVVSGGSSFLGTLTEEYMAPESMKEWTISNVNADPIFVDFVDGFPGRYEWSRGMDEIPEGTYYISYTMTVPEGDVGGTYAIDGHWLDVDHPQNLEVAGEDSITVDSAAMDGEETTAQAPASSETQFIPESNGSSIPEEPVSEEKDDNNSENVENDVQAISTPASAESPVNDAPQEKQEIPALNAIWVLISIVVLARLSGKE